MSETVLMEESVDLPLLCIGGCADGQRLRPDDIREQDCPETTDDNYRLESIVGQNADGTEWQVRFFVQEDMPNADAFRLLMERYQA